jgi:hypothetical protein
MAILYELTISRYKCNRDIILSVSIFMVLTRNKESNVSIRAQHVIAYSNVSYLLQLRPAYTSSDTLLPVSKITISMFGHQSAVSHWSSTVTFSLYCFNYPNTQTRRYYFKVRPLERSISLVMMLLATCSSYLLHIPPRIS